MTTDNKIFSFNLKTIIIALFSIITVVGGSVYTIVKLSMDDKNSALEISVSERNTKIIELEEKLDELNRINKVAYPIESTTEYIAEGNNNSEIEKLKERVNQLENERNKILNELILKTYNDLDPKSELSVLIKELSSDSKEKRKKALEGLFILKDPKSINALLAYYFNNPEEANEFKYYPDWIEMISELNKEAGQDFAIEMLKSENDYMSYWGYKFFLEDINSKDEMKQLVLKLNSVAINNPNTLTRTRAKYIIADYTNRLKSEDDINDNRSMFRVILDIEKKIDNIKK